MQVEQRIRGIAAAVGLGHAADRFTGDGRPEFAPIVLGGCGRSGTTLLRMILDSHPAICCGPESNVFRRSAIDPEELAAKFDLDRGRVRAIHAAAASRPAFIEAFAALCMQRAGKRRWAEKTPRNVRRLETIFRHFPRARFVHLLRDGRDVACSLRTHPRHKVVNGELVPLDTWKPIAGCARRWRDDIERSRPYWSDPRFLTLRYEELVRDPRPVLARLMTFVGESWDERLLEHAGAGSPFRDVTTFAQNPEALEPLNTKAISRWERDLDQRDRRIFKRIAGKLLIELGYAQNLDW
jgi:protein-tyrosine sulfotransferase